MVTYTAAFGYQTVSFNGKKDSNKTFSENDTLGYKSFKLKSAKEADEFGRPTIKWTYDVGDKSTTVEVEALATYTEAAKNCDIYADSGLKKSTKLDVYTNSKTSDGTYTVADNKDDSKQAKQGRLTLVYGIVSSTSTPTSLRSPSSLLRRPTPRVTPLPLTLSLTRMSTVTKASSTPSSRLRTSSRLTIWFWSPSPTARSSPWSRLSPRTLF